MYHPFLRKYLEVGIVEVIQTQEHNRFLDALVGLYQLATKFKIQVMFVELIGMDMLPIIQHPPQEHPDLGIGVIVNLTLDRTILVGHGL